MFYHVFYSGGSETNYLNALEDPRYWAPVTGPTLLESFQGFEGSWMIFGTK
jgi:hypothetical protein